jgi:hypothetical protein
LHSDKCLKDVHLAYQDILNIKDEDLDKEIYRIMPIHQLLEIFETKQLTLVKPSMWDDPFENLLLNVSPVRDAVYGQCWTLHKETDAMWRIYSQNKQGAKVKTTIRKLIEALQLQSGQYLKIQCFIGEVEYLTQRQLVDKLIS